MSGTISALDQGHEHANNATDYYARGLLIPAAEEHYKAAEAFQKCVNQSTDEHTKNTLRKLCSHHLSVGKDLQRRIAKLREEGKDPALPQVTQTTRASNGIDNEGAGSGLHVPSRGRNLDSSATTFDESFMVLNQQSDNNTEDSPFDLFWKVTGDIMYNLSQPMSFQTAAMAALDAVESRTASTQSENGQNEAKGADPGLEKSSQKKSGTLKPSQNLDDDEFDSDDGDYDSLDDFYFVQPTPSSDLSPPSQLKRENAELKSKLEAMEKQMGAVRRQIALRNEQDQHLRDNIMLARKEAQRAMAASTSFAAPSVQSMANLAGVNTGLNLNTPQVPGAFGRDTEVALVRRTRELEEELRVVRLENEKQKQSIAKFRDRWERLKESAKRKKMAKAMSTGQTEPGVGVSVGVRERIDEDVEGEAAAEASGKEAN